MTDQKGYEGKKRRKIILEIIESKQIENQREIQEELNERGLVGISQGTISRDLNQLNISKNAKGVYSTTHTTLKNIYEEDLIEIIKQNKPFFYENISYKYLKTGKGNASQFALHLQTLFSDVILEITIKEEGLLLLIDMDKEKAQDLFDLLKQD